MSIRSRESSEGRTLWFDEPLRRAAASIPANIAEGCDRTGAAELGRFIQIAMGSANEVGFHFLLARDLGLLDIADFERLSSQVVEVKRMLTSFWQKLRTC